MLSTYRNIFTVCQELLPAVLCASVDYQFCVSCTMYIICITSKHLNNSLTVPFPISHFTKSWSPLLLDRVPLDKIRYRRIPQLLQLPSRNGRGLETSLKGSGEE